MANVTYHITVSGVEDQILKHVVGDPTNWLRTAVRQKAITAANRWINQNTKYRANRLTMAEKIQIIQSALGG